MTESEADELYAKAESFMGPQNSVIDVFRPYHNIGRVYSLMAEAGDIYMKCECFDKAGFSYHYAGLLAKILGLCEISAKHYELAGHFFGSLNRTRSVVEKIRAFEMYEKINNIKGLERCSAYILQNMDSSDLSRSFSSKYYGKGLEKLVKYAQKHGIPRLLSKLKYKYMKYLFKEEGLKTALTFYQEVILYHRPWDLINDRIELSCVCVCVLAILRREANATKETEHVCELYQEVENNSQNLTAKSFWECLTKRNIEGLEETVERLSAMNECHERNIEDAVSEHAVEDPCKDLIEDFRSKKVFEDSGTELVVEDPGTSHIRD